MKTVFIDRDGVINRRLIGDWAKNWEEFEMLPGVPEAVAKLKKAGYRCIVVTNQRGISLGYFTRKDLDEIHKKMNEEFIKEGGSIDDIFVCPHGKEDGCGCRKPAPGLFYQAAEKYPDLSLEDSVMFGDKDTDRQAAISAGCAHFYLVSDDKPLIECVNNFLNQK